jgi:hypothetical protein
MLTLGVDHLNTATSQPKPHESKNGIEKEQNRGGGEEHGNPMNGIESCGSSLV